MKFLIIDTYYQDFINKVRRENIGLQKKSYNVQLNYYLNLCFGTSDYYSYNLKKLGHQAVDIIANEEILQRTWARENNINTQKNGIISKLQNAPLIYKFLGKPNWMQEIVLAQIKNERPDVLYVQNLSILNPCILKKAKKYVNLLVGQIASPLPPQNYLKTFDLILTSFPHFVEKFRKIGINSEYFRIGFEERVYNKFKKTKKKYDLTFVGGISPSHKRGLRMLNYLAQNTHIDVWGYGKKYLLPKSKLYKSHHGEAWALDMYKILSESKISINRHIDVAENYANNMRLFEATGMGAMLITDKKDNLNELFNEGKEVIGYNNHYDLLKKINYYLKHDKMRSRVAIAGQKRTLKEHTYFRRMKELIKIIEQYA